jgi:outer membrane lipoprotein SlyB
METSMKKTALHATSLAAATLALGWLPATADAQSRVQYGRITNAVVVTEQSGSAATVGTILGGGIGLASGSGQSGSNRALRTVGGAAAGRGIGNLAGRSQAFEYTVLIGQQTVRVVSDQAGKRVGDCVAVETGQFSNIRLVPDARCNPPAAAPRPPAAPAAPPAAAPAPRPPAAVPAADQSAANACDQAKLQVLNAETDEAFALAERRMRLLCGE